MPEHFENVLQVVAYLKENGHRVSKSSVYNHVKVGRLAKGKDGYFGLAAVKKYAAALQAGSDIGIHDQATLSEKQDADTRKAAAQAKHWEIKTKILQGKYVEREWAERQLAARAMVIKSDMENFFRSRAPEIIAKSDGKGEFAPDVIEYLLQNMETMLGRYAEPIEFQTNPDAHPGEN
jgi:hypothetical protein